MSALGLLALVTALSGCTARDPFAEHFYSGKGKGYLSADGTVTQFAAEERGDPISFSVEDTAGRTVTAEQFRGGVLVLNFWFAECGPCRIEAADLRAVSEAEAGKAAFLGVNTRDSGETAVAFVRTFEVNYENVLDGRDSAVQLAVAGSTAPRVTPATLVLDAEGRVSGRILGPVDRDVLSGLIEDAAG